MKVVVYANFYFVDVISLEHLSEVLIEAVLRKAVLLAPCHKPVLVDLCSGYHAKILSSLVEVLDYCHVTV